MATNVSAATDLGALLRESIDSGLNAAAPPYASGQMPIELAPMSGVQPIVPWVVPPAAPSTTRAVVVEAVPVAATPKIRSGVLGIVLGAVVLASAMGGGAVWYVHHHQAKMAAAAMAKQDVAPPVAKDAPPPAEAKVEMPVLVTPPATETKNEAKTEETAAPAAPEPAKVDTKSAKRTHRTTTTKPVAEAPKPVAKAEKAVAEKAPEAPKPAPKAAGGAVDAVLQQQLSGAL